MSDLEVEAVSDLQTADAAEFILYGGKGGVGKTTMAAATGLASATEGTDTLVVSTDPAHSLADVFSESLAAEPVQVGDLESLWAVEIDPQEALGDAALFGEGGGLSVPGLEELIGADAEGEAMPGADEAAALHHLLTLLDDDRFDRVIVDTAPTGHTLRLLELPEALDSLLGRVLQFRERLQGAFGSVNPFDDAKSGDGTDIEAARQRVERLRGVLRDPRRTDFRIVMQPESLSVRETRRLKESLEAYDIPVGTLVVNRVMEPPEAVGDVDSDTFVTPDLEGCRFCRRRWDVQKAALEDAQDLFRGVDVRRVPLFADEVAGRPMLRVVASCLS
jgi:arsenite-transporting ATPase